MKNLFLFILLSCIVFNCRSQQAVSINTTGTAANSSAILDVSSTTKGMLIPRMDSTQRKAILNTAVGLMVFDNSTNSFWFYQASGWTELQSVSTNPWQKNGSNIYNSNTGDVGVGITTPVTKLHVRDTLSSNPATFDGVSPMWVTLAEGGVDRGYIGSYSGSATDVDFGTYGSNTTGKVHLTTSDIPRLSVMPNGNVGINNQNAQRKLEVLGDVKADSVFITNTATATDFLIVQDANGQVGHRKTFYGLGLNYCIALEGVFPSQGRPSDSLSTSTTLSADPFVGEIMLFAGNFAPNGWAFCNGQLMSISQNVALFSILGTTYGGNGTTTFALPDLRDAVPVDFGNSWLLGQSNK